MELIPMKSDCIALQPATESQKEYTHRVELCDRLPGLRIVGNEYSLRVVGDHLNRNFHFGFPARHQYTLDRLHVGLRPIFQGGLWAADLLDSGQLMPHSSPERGGGRR